MAKDCVLGKINSLYRHFGNFCSLPRSSVHGGSAATQESFLNGFKTDETGILDGSVTIPIRRNVPATKNSTRCKLAGTATRERLRRDVVRNFLTSLIGTE